jgi:hypothetical protein
MAHFSCNIRPWAYCSFNFVCCSICIEECTIPNEHDILCSLPSSQNEVQDTRRKFIISSENMSVLVTQKEVEQRSLNIHVSTKYFQGICLMGMHLYNRKVLNLMYIFILQLLYYCHWTCIPHATRYIRRFTE